MYVIEIIIWKGWHNLWL